MKLVCKPLFEGIMAYWDKVEDAVCYHAMLYIDDNVISNKNVERSQLYCYFKGLASVGHWVETGHRHLPGDYGRRYDGSKYFVQVVAENRKGEIIDWSEKVESQVKESI